jgi:hypothetical protein
MRGTHWFMLLAAFSVAMFGLTVAGLPQFAWIPALVVGYCCGTIPHGRSL